MYNLYMILVFLLHACLLASPPLKRPPKIINVYFPLFCFSVFHNNVHREHAIGMCLCPYHVYIGIVTHCLGFLS